MGKIKATFILEFDDELIERATNEDKDPMDARKAWGEMTEQLAKGMVYNNIVRSYDKIRENTCIVDYTFEKMVDPSELLLFKC